MVLFMFGTSRELKKHFRDGVDVACNAFHNARYFKVDRYTGLDIENPETPLPFGLPNSEFRLSDVVHDRIPDGDLVMCVETVGITALFEHERSLEVSKKLVDAVRPGGTLVFNIGPHTSLEDAEKIVTLTRLNFGKVRHIRYGRWSKPCNPALAFAGGLALFLLPFLRRPSAIEGGWHLFFASSKRELRNV